MLLVLGNITPSNENEIVKKYPVKVRIPMAASDSNDYRTCYVKNLLLATRLLTDLLKDNKSNNIIHKISVQEFSNNKWYDNTVFAIRTAQDNIEVLEEFEE